MLGSILSPPSVFEVDGLEFKVEFDSCLTCTLVDSVSLLIPSNITCAAADTLGALLNIVGGGAVVVVIVVGCGGKG